MFWWKCSLFLCPCVFIRRRITCLTNLEMCSTLFLNNKLDRLFLSLTSMASTPPHNFSWVEPGKLAGLAMPRMTSEYQYLLDNGIKHLVCLCERKPPYYNTCPELNLHHIKIADFTPPTPTQIEKFLAIVEDANSKGEVRRQLFKRLWLMEGYSCWHEQEVGGVYNVSQVQKLWKCRREALICHNCARLQTALVE